MTTVCVERPTLTDYNTTGYNLLLPNYSVFSEGPSGGEFIAGPGPWYSEAGSKGAPAAVGAS